jgi:hypothetical protein
MLNNPSKFLLTGDRCILIAVARTAMMLIFWLSASPRQDLCYAKDIPKKKMAIEVGLFK